MKTRTIHWTLLAVLLISFTGNAAATEKDYSNNLTDRYASHGSQDLVINNHSLDQGDYIYDYYYASRIRRFHQPAASFSYYHSYYTDCYWYTYDPVYWGFSIYLGSFWNPVRLRVSYGGPIWRSSYYVPYYSWYSPAVYSYYYTGPSFGMVYRPAFVNHNYYGNWYSYRSYYSRPYRTIYSNRPYYSRYEDNYNYYSRSLRNENSLESRYYSNRNSGNAVRSNSGSSLTRSSASRPSTSQVRSSGTRTSTSTVQGSQKIPSRSSGTVRSTQPRSNTSTTLRKPSSVNSSRSSGVRVRSTNSTRKVTSTRSSSSNNRAARNSSSTKKANSRSAERTSQSKRKK
jgi:hypothetical protein